MPPVDPGTKQERKLLVAFINSDPADIKLKRREKIPSPSGGHTLGPPTTLPTQRFRLVPFKRRLTHMAASGQGGEGAVTSLPYVLVGKHDADVKRGDYFDHKGLRYEVGELEPNRRVRTAAEITEKGATNG